MLDKIVAGLKQHIDPVLVDELLAAHMEAKRCFYDGGLRLNAVEGGRFCEAALRIIQQLTTGSFTPLGKQIDSEKVINSAPNFTTLHDSVRFHIPRSIRVVYDIRNKRDAAHLAEDVDPNLQDATLVVSVIDWILAEFIRLYHSVSPQEAQAIVDALVKRSVPAIESFNGFLKVLKPKMGATDFVLLILYECGVAGAAYNDLYNWVRPKMRANLRRTLNALVNESARVHASGDRFVITKLGIADVEKRRLHSA